MPVKQTIPFSAGTFFITFSCFNWISLIEIVNGYDIVYKWFDYLKKQGHYINGFVIMPNHLHILITFREAEQTINTFIGNGKRFMAYEIIKRLEAAGNIQLLNQLTEAVEPARKAKNKKHEVWQLSFDWKECRSDKFIDQKLSYIHDNPCSKKWNLCEAPVEYLHSSARFYSIGEQSIYSVTNISEMKDVSLINLNNR